MSELVKELPTDPEEGCVVWVPLDIEGHWSKQLFTQGEWHCVGGMSVPYLPNALEGKQGDFNA